MDLIVRNARLATMPSGGPVDIGVVRGQIVAIEKDLAGEAEIYDACERLTCAGLIETHIHLDKSRIIARAPPGTERDIRPMAQVAVLKGAFTVEDVRTRAEHTLRECILNGATRMRTQVEVDPAVGLRGFEGVQSLIADFKWAIDIEICVFPQDGLTNYPGTDELLVESLKRGAKVIGGAPRYDTDHAGQIRRIFELACEFDVDIDIHLDVGNTPEAMDIHLVCELTEQYRRGGRVVVGHMAKLSTMPPREARPWPATLPISASRSPFCRRPISTWWAAIRTTMSAAASPTPISWSSTASIARYRPTTCSIRRHLMAIAR